MARGFVAVAWRLVAVARGLVAVARGLAAAISSTVSTTTTEPPRCDERREVADGEGEPDIGALLTIDGGFDRAIANAVDLHALFQSICHSYAVK